MSHVTCPQVQLPSWVVVSVTTVVVVLTCWGCGCGSTSVVVLVAEGLAYSSASLPCQTHRQCQCCQQYCSKLLHCMIVPIAAVLYSLWAAHHWRPDSGSSNVHTSGAQIGGCDCTGSGLVTACACCEPQSRMNTNPAIGASLFGMSGMHAQDCNRNSSAAKATMAVFLFRSGVFGGVRASLWMCK